MAAGDHTPTRFYGPAQPGTSVADLYDVPASRIAVVKTIFIANTTDSEAWLSLSVGSTAVDTAASRIVDTLAVPSVSSVNHGLVMIDVPLLALTATDFITGKQGTASALTVTISGVLIEI